MWTAAGMNLGHNVGMSIRVAVVIVALAVLGLSGCASPRAGTSPPPAPPTTLRGSAALRGVDPCALLTRVEVGRAIGHKVAAPTRRAHASVPVCVWRNAGSPGSHDAVTVQLMPAWVFRSTARLPHQAQRLPATARSRVRWIDGIGDAAYTVSLVDQTRTWHEGGDLAAVRVGDRSAFVSVDTRQGGDTRSLTRAVALARRLAPRLVAARR